MSIPNSPNWAQTNVPPLNYVDYGIVEPPEIAGVDVQKCKIGPLVLGDSQGDIAERFWLATYGSPNIFIRGSNGGYWGTPVFLFSELELIVSIDLTFDQVGRPIIIYLTNDGDVKLYWYDPVQEMQVVDVISTGSSVAAGFDIPTNTSDSMSDAMIAYVRDNALYWRLQRDRWAIEYDPSVTHQDLRVLSMGITDQNRFQIEYDFTGSYTPSKPINTTLPIVTGSTVVGSTLSSTQGDWVGTAVITYDYQWYSDGLPISGETESTYLTTVLDTGNGVKCVVTGTNSAGSASASSNEIYIDSAPSILTPPVITGSSAVGSTLTSDDGVWAGSEPITYTYQWALNGSDISGETSSSYTTVAADTGGNITCSVTATNYINSSSATSNTIVVDALPFLVSRNGEQVGDNATLTSITVGTPPPVNDGDLYIAALCWRGSTAPAVPVGWAFVGTYTLLGPLETFKQQISLYTKFAGAAGFNESVTFSGMEPNVLTCQTYAVEFYKTIASVETLEYNGGSPLNPKLTTGKSKTICIGHWLYGVGTVSITGGDILGATSASPPLIKICGVYNEDPANYNYYRDNDSDTASNPNFGFVLIEIQ